VRQSQTLIAGLCLQHLTAVSEARVASLLQPLVDNLNTIQKVHIQLLEGGNALHKNTCFKYLNDFVRIVEYIYRFVTFSGDTKDALQRYCIYTGARTLCALLCRVCTIDFV